MSLPMRIVMTIVIFMATLVVSGLFSYWLAFVQVVPRSEFYIAQCVSVVVAMLAAVFIWRRKGSGAAGLLAAAVCGAILVGSLAFVGGFFGPLILYPEANQGPLFGIFVTGPLGLVVGYVLGGAWWWFSRR